MSILRDSERARTAVSATAPLAHFRIFSDATPRAAKHIDSFTPFEALKAIAARHV